MDVVTETHCPICFFEFVTPQTSGCPACFPEVYGGRGPDAEDVVDLDGLVSDAVEAELLAALVEGLAEFGCETCEWCLGPATHIRDLGFNLLGACDSCDPHHTKPPLYMEDEDDFTAEDARDAGLSVRSATSLDWLDDELVVPVAELVGKTEPPYHRDLTCPIAVEDEPSPVAFDSKGRRYIPGAFERTASDVAAEQLGGYISGDVETLYDITADSSFILSPERVITAACLLGMFPTSTNYAAMPNNARRWLNNAWVVDTSKYRRAMVRADQQAFDADDAADARETLRWLARDEAETTEALLLRWDSSRAQRIEANPFLDADEKKKAVALASEEKAAWIERMTQQRRVELHMALAEWFGSGDYVNGDREVVVSWDLDEETGRWSPGERMEVVAWVKSEVEAKGALSAYAACLRLIQRRIASRNRRPQRVNGKLVTRIQH